MLSSGSMCGSAANQPGSSRGRMLHSELLILVKSALYKFSTAVDIIFISLAFLILFWSVPYVYKVSGAVF